MNMGRIGSWLLALGSIFTLILSPAPAAAAADRLPDLQMAPLRDLRVEVTPGGQRRLRFTAEIVNLGDGPFELHGSRPSADQPLIEEVRQRIYDDAGGWRERATVAEMFFAGDGHTHWHVRDLERYTLSTAAGDPTGLGMKSGYCFFDNNRYRPDLPGSPTLAHYRSCGEPDSLAVEMGISLGWGDIYGWDLPDQYIDITGLPPGIYLLTAVADPDDWFTEIDEANNTITLAIRLTDTGVDTLVHSAYLPAVAAAP